MQNTGKTDLQPSPTQTNYDDMRWVGISIRLALYTYVNDVLARQPQFKRVPDTDPAAPPPKE